jgi:hypothetical protein
LWTNDILRIPDPLTPLIWRLLTFGYLGVWTPPSRGQIRWTRATFWTQSPNFWTQYRSKNEGRFLTNGWRAWDGLLRTTVFTINSDHDITQSTFWFRLLGIGRNYFLNSLYLNWLFFCKNSRRSDFPTFQCRRHFCEDEGLEANALRSKCLNENINDYSVSERLFGDSKWPNFRYRDGGDGSLCQNLENLIRWCWVSFVVHFRKWPFVGTHEEKYKLNQMTAKNTSHRKKFGIDDIKLFSLSMPRQVFEGHVPVSDRFEIRILSHSRLDNSNFE